MLQEVSRKVINLNKYEEVIISWNNSVLSLRGNKELHLLEFSYNLNSLENGIDFIENTVSCSKSSPVSEDYFTEYVSRGVKNLELVEMVTNPSFWPHNQLLMHELVNITAYQWSPFNQQSDNDRLLAALNTVGNIEFFGPRRHSWYSILDFTSLMKAHLNENLDKLCKNPRNFTELKQSVYYLQTVAFCWASKLNEDKSCYFITAQKSGDVMFWSIKYHLGYFETEFCGGFQHTNDTKMSQMLWISTDPNKVLLVGSYDNGEIIGYECQIIEKLASLLKVHNLWSHKDKMVATYLQYIFMDDKLLLIFNKHRHLIIQMYDNDLKLLFQNLQNVNDYKITSLSKYKDTFYLTTINRNMYKINCSIVDGIMQVCLEEIKFKDPGQSYELFGVAVSTNSALFALAMINRKLLLNKQTVSAEVIFYSQDSELDADVMKMINNPTKELTHMWDIIELFRCKAMKFKKLPVLDYGLLLNDEKNIYNLKIYLIILKLYHNLVNYVVNGLKELLPETSEEVIKEKILTIHAFTQIYNIHYANFNGNPCFGSLDNECFAASKSYLDDYCKKYNKNMSDFVETDVLKKSDVRFKYLCQWCDEILTNFLCKNKHVNMICSLTFTPIENDYLVCKSCNATARMELYSQNPTCVFCDLYLINSDLINSE